MQRSAVHYIRVSPGTVETESSAAREGSAGDGQLTEAEGEESECLGITITKDTRMTDVLKELTAHTFNLAL